VTDIDPKLSQIYREASSEGPPAALDAAILAAARKQVAKPQRRARSSWVRWMAPASALATLVVAVSLAFLVEREQPGTPDGTAIRAIPPRPQSPPAAAPESAKMKADSAAPAPAATPPAQVPVPLPAVVAPPAAEAFPAESRAKAAESRMSAPKAAESKTMRESNVAGDAALGAARTAAPAASAGAPTSPAAAGKLAPLRQQAIQRSPEAWLDEISRLKREGRDKEAAEQLAEFRKAYPAYAVPESLRVLQ
jgi:hypothetical protein